MNHYVYNYILDVARYSWLDVLRVNSLRENGNSPSASGFPECQISGTRGRNSSPSVALGEEMHSGKRVFPECLMVHGTRGREALGEDPLPRVHFFSTRGSQPLPRVPHPSTRGSKPLPRVPHPSTRGRVSSPSASVRHSGKNFFVFCFFASFFL
jgi:hypothetical protein